VCTIRMTTWNTNTHTHTHTHTRAHTVFTLLAIGVIETWTRSSIDRTMRTLHFIFDINHHFYQTLDRITLTNRVTSPSHAIWWNRQTREKKVKLILCKWFKWSEIGRFRREHAGNVLISPLTDPQPLISRKYLLLLDTASRRYTLATLATAN